jgi:hypoxanthine-guanine phosphoribosyltransferase
MSQPTGTPLYAPSFLLPYAWVRAVRHSVQSEHQQSASVTGMGFSTVTLKMDLSTDVKGRDVLLVEDIVDTGCVVPLVSYACMT